MKFGEYVNNLNETVNVSENGPDVEEVIRDHKVLNSEVVLNIETGHKWEEERNILVSIKNMVYNYEKGRTVIVRHSALGETVNIKEFKNSIKSLKEVLAKMQKEYMADIEKALTTHGFEFVLSRDTAKAKPAPKETPKEDDELGDLEIEDLDDEDKI
jgi:hypothetical protein